MAPLLSNTLFGPHQGVCPFMLVDDPIQSLSELALDIEAYLSWQTLCGAQLLPVGGPALPPPPEALPPEPAQTFRPPASQAPTASEPAPAPAAPQPAPAPVLQPAAQPRVHKARALTNQWSHFVNAPRKAPTGAEALQELTDRIGPGAICSACRNRLIPSRGKGLEPILVVSGQTLVKDASLMLAAMVRNVLKIEPSSVFVIQVHHRCRSFYKPGQGELPSDCGHLLRAQIKLMKPRLMLILGREASRALLPPQRIQIGRGRWVDYRTIDGALPSLMTFHPNFLVLNPDHKRHAFEDLKMFKARMDKELS